jgi:hypothetical protein
MGTRVGADDLVKRKKSLLKEQHQVKTSNRFNALEVTVRTSLGLVEILQKITKSNLKEV